MELNSVNNYRLPTFLVAAFITGVSTVFAQTQVHQLGVAPLLGVTPSTPALRQKIAEHPEMVREAAKEIGLTSSEYRAFMKKLQNEKPYWGSVPRHLDAMSWSANGHVYAIHDVVIPSGVNGWEVELRERHQVVAIYIPMICGNLSVVRTPIHQVAVAPPLPPRHVFAPPPVVPVPVPLVAAEVPPAQMIPPVAPPAAVIHHPHLFWPILAAAVAGVIIASNHHNDHSSQPALVVGGPSTLPGGSGGGIVTVTPDNGGWTPGHCGCGD